MLTSEQMNHFFDDVAALDRQIKRAEGMLAYFLRCSYGSENDKTRQYRYDIARMKAIRAGQSKAMDALYAGEM